MKIEEAVKSAIEHTRRMISECEGDEKAVFNAFAEEFDAEMEGWNVRIQELEAEDDDRN